MYIPQKQLKKIESILTPNKAVIIYGPRRCGKTTLIQKFLEKNSERSLFVSGEDITVQSYLESQSIEKLKEFVGSSRLVVIDEAQRVKNIGLNLKLILDHIPGIKVIATGSSSFELAGAIGEPLTGRKYTLRLFPLAQLELQDTETRVQTDARLENRLIYGSYPEIILMDDNGKKELYLKEMVNSYLAKDILALEGLKYPDKLIKLLRLLAFQIGKEVSYNELATQLSMSKNTVERYLDLLEKAFVIFKISGLSSNSRKEISKSPRYYFYDNGIRNEIIQRLNRLEFRDDVGMLWENYIISERIKKQEYCNISSQNYFWRSYDQQEVDWVEEQNGKFYAYEITWSKKQRMAPKGWLVRYPQSIFTCINPENYLEFIA